MSKRNRWIERVAGTAIAVLLTARVHLLLVRLYDPDEFEHIHAGFSVFRGEVPYRDFFEHHGPLTYWLSGAIVHAWGPSTGLLTVHRLLSFGLALACAAGTWQLAKCLFGRRAAVWAVVAMLTLPSFVEKQVEWRPDVIATAMIPWGAWLLVRQDRSYARVGLASGLLLGVATLATLKSAPLVLGLATGAWYTRKARGERCIGQLLAGGIGLSIPWLLSAAILWRQGALLDAYRCLIETPLSWPNRIHGGGYLFGITAWAPGHQLLGLAGIVLGMIGLGKRRYRRIGEPVLVCGILFHAAGLLLASAVYFQFYMLAVPLLAALSTGCLRRVIRVSARSKVLGRVAGPLAYGLAAIALAWLATGLWQQFRRGATGPYGWVDGGTCLAALLFVVVVVLNRSWKATWLALAMVLLTPAIGRIAIPHFFWPKERQVASIEFVNRVVPSDQAVLDGFTGFGLLRPHASYWWWVNEHTLGMMERSGGQSEFTGLVASGSPGLVILDGHLARLIRPELLARHYVSVGGPFWLRGDLLERAKGTP